MTLTETLLLVISLQLMLIAWIAGYIAGKVK